MDYPHIVLQTAAGDPSMTNDHYEAFALINDAGQVVEYFRNTNAGDYTNGGLLYYLYQGVKLGIYPPLIFLGIGAMTDFGPLIANPSSFILGAAAQIGIFVTFVGAILLGFTGKEASSIGIIGGADGPTAIYVTGKLAPDLLGPIAVAAYSYMALVPLIQPPIMRLLTTKKERAVVMSQLRPVTKTEKVVFPIAVTLIVSLMVPSACPLVGMLMLGNLMKESGVCDRLVKTAQNELMNIVTDLPWYHGWCYCKCRNLPFSENPVDHLPRFTCFCFGFRIWRTLRQDHVRVYRWQGQPADWFGWCIGCSDGCSCFAESWRRRKPDQLPPHACDGPERCWRYRFRSCSWCVDFHLWIILVFAFKPSRICGKVFLLLPFNRKQEKSPAHGFLCMKEQSAKK